MRNHKACVLQRINSSIFLSVPRSVVGLIVASIKDLGTTEGYTPLARIECIAHPNKWHNVPTSMSKPAKGSVIRWSLRYVCLFMH
jgi:hypothetical protein